MKEPQDPREPYITSEYDAELLRLAFEVGLDLDEYDAFIILTQERQESD